MASKPNKNTVETSKTSTVENDTMNTESTEKAKRSYNCGICGEEGHQSRKCEHDFVSKLPTEGADYLAVLADIKAQNYTENVVAFLAAAWGVNEQLKARSKVRKTGQGKRACTECGEFGHNAATCERDKPQRTYLKALSELAQVRIFGAPDSMEASRFMAEAVRDKVVTIDAALDFMRDRDTLSEKDSAYFVAKLPKLEKAFLKTLAKYKQWEARKASKAKK